MKSRRLWSNFIVHSSQHDWKLKPTSIRSDLIYKSGNKMWICPVIEFSWLFIVLQFTFYSRKKEYNCGYFEDDTIEILQSKICRLEEAIRKHKLIGSRNPKAEDRNLWSVLNEND